MVACLEEIAYRMGYITAGQLIGLADRMSSSPYGQYIRRVLEQD
jgi:glucose-1-phosphate thymidylyltransferase